MFGNAGPATVIPSIERRPAQSAEPQLAEPPEVVFAAERGWTLDWRELWRFRDLLVILAWRDLKIRYKQTLLGAGWAVLQPTLGMLLFTLFFGRMAHAPSGGLPYALFVYCGLLVWTLFAGAVSGAAASVVSSEQLITKVYFPRLLIPMAAVGVGLVDFTVALSVLMALMGWYGIGPGWSVLWAPLLVALTMLAAIGFGAFLAALSVKYRDFRLILPVLMQFWMLATPAIYIDLASADATAALPYGLEFALNGNPLNGLVVAFRAALVGAPVNWQALAWPATVIVVVFFGGCLFFGRVEDSFADTI
jgi:lipopolysaccharide transport system permease protein